MLENTLPKVPTNSKRVRSPGRPRDASRDKAILEETIKILAENGFAGLKLDDIVKHAKVSKATIYRRWATKEELAIAAFNLLPEIEIAESGDLFVEILDYIEQYNEYLHNTPLHSVLPALVSEATHNEALAAQLRETVERRRTPGIAIMQRAIDRGELPAGTDARMAHELIIGPLMHRSFFDPNNIHRDDFAKMAKIIVAGLKAGAGVSSGTA